MDACNKIDYIEFPAHNLTATREFFTTVFGWEFTDYGPDYTSFSDGRISGGFYLNNSKAIASSGSALIVLYQYKSPCRIPSR